MEATCGRFDEDEDGDKDEEYEDDDAAADEHDATAPPSSSPSPNRERRPLLPPDVFPLKRFHLDDGTGAAAVPFSARSALPCAVYFWICARSRPPPRSRART